MRVFLWSVLSISLGFGSTAFAELLSVEHEGLDRIVWLENTGPTPRPLIVMLHGYMNETRHQKLIDGNFEKLAWDKLNIQAQAHGFALAYPSSLKGRWAVAPHSDLNRHPNTGDVLDDLGFIEKMVDRLVTSGTAKKDEVYLVGYSNGSKLAYYFACEPDHPFAAFVTLTGSIHETVATDCDPKVVPYLAMAGTNDRILGYDGWTYPSGRTLSTPETMHIFVKAHGCRGQSWFELPDVVPTDNSTVRLVWWRDCNTADGSVRLLRVEGAGHTVPQPELGDPDWVKRAGGQNQDIETAEYVVKFLSGLATLPATE